MSCSVCGKKTTALGLCSSHYYSFRRYGDANAAGVKPHGSVDVRFWAKVQKTDGCWIWTGGKTKFGYGVIQEAGKGSKLLLAHRLSYAIHNGEIKSGLNVLHSCDNPSCVNPSHLRCGTASDNQQDAYSRKRRVSPFSKKENRYQGQRTGHPGAANPNAKLTEDDVRAIRSSFDEPRKLAEQYNILPEYVNRIRNRMAWKHVE